MWGQLETTMAVVAGPRSTSSSSTREASAGLVRQHARALALLATVVPAHVTCMARWPVQCRCSHDAVGTGAGRFHAGTWRWLALVVQKFAAHGARWAEHFCSFFPAGYSIFLLTHMRCYSVQVGYFVPAHPPFSVAVAPMVLREPMGDEAVLLHGPFAGVLVLAMMAFVLHPAVPHAS